jgi:RecB family exonuclease
MIMRWITRAVAVALLLTPLSVFAAMVKPLEVVTERIIVLEMERLAAEHAVSSALVRRALERLDKQMNIMSRERTTESLKLLADAREAVTVADRSATSLSRYVESNRARFKDGGHGRFLPLARLNNEVEKPYHTALDRFLATATDFVQYCNDNLDAITSGQQLETRRYEEYYAAYLKDMEAFNAQSMKRSQLLGDWASEYPALLEYLPR